MAEKTTMKHVGDVIGLSRARVLTRVPRTTADRSRKPRRMEVPRFRRATLRRARVVGGVRGHGH
jgi:hypothetical protein